MEKNNYSFDDFNILLNVFVKCLLIMNSREFLNKNIKKNNLEIILDNFYDSKYGEELRDDIESLSFSFLKEISDEHPEYFDDIEGEQIADNDV